MSQKGSALPDSFWIQFVQMCQRLKAEPYSVAAVMNSESGFNPSARNMQNGAVVAQGLNQLIKSTAKGIGISDELWNNFYKLSPEEHLKWSEKFFQLFGNRLKGKSPGDIYLLNFGGFNNPDGSLYAGKNAQERWLKDHPNDKFKNPKYQQLAIEQNKGFVENDRIMPERVKKSVAGGPPKDIKDKIDAAIKVIGNKEPPAFEAPNPNWTGSSDEHTTKPDEKKSEPESTPSNKDSKPSTPAPTPAANSLEDYLVNFVKQELAKTGMLKTAFIRKLPDGKYRVFSEKGKNMGTFPSLQQAKKRLKQIEFFKHQDHNSAKDSENIVLKIEDPSYISLLRSIKNNCEEEVLKFFMESYIKYFDDFYANDHDPINMALSKVILDLGKKFNIEIEYDKKKTAAISERSPQDLGKNIANSITTLLLRLKKENRNKTLSNLIYKIYYMDPYTLSTKKLPPSAAIGQSLIFVKNMLYGVNPTFARQVLNNICRELHSSGKI